MVKGHTFDRGDIISINFEPSKGNEIQGVWRPALILSKAAFNSSGVAFIAPITKGGGYARAQGFTVSLAAANLETEGVVLVYQAGAFDILARNAKFIEKAPPEIVEDVLARVIAILE